jgi:ribosomal protein L37AE/L43A
MSVETSSNRICPNCGKHMVQQFIGLYHCKCGTGRINGGYIERTPDMVFALERHTVGNKTKQAPIIRYKSES